MVWHSYLSNNDSFVASITGLAVSTAYFLTPWTKIMQYNVDTYKARAMKRQSVIGGQEGQENVWYKHVNLDFDTDYDRRNPMT